MPSILVETAFLSNDKEEQRLKDLQYHDVTAEGILEGVRTYISGTR
jgi:N-acetylmuramoyl-L-alanine amidase